MHRYNKSRRNWRPFSLFSGEFIDGGAFKGTVRLRNLKGEVGMVYGIGIKLSFKAQGAVVCHLHAVFAGFIRSLIEGIELNAGHIGINLHDSAADFIGCHCVKPQTFAVNAEVMVKAAADPHQVIVSEHVRAKLLACRKIKTGTFNRRNFTCGDKIVADLGVVGCVYPQCYVKHVFAVISGEVKNE